MTFTPRYQPASRTAGDPGATTDTAGSRSPSASPHASSALDRARLRRRPAWRRRSQTVGAVLSCNTRVPSSWTDRSSRGRAVPATWRRRPRPPPRGRAPHRRPSAVGEAASISGSPRDPAGGAAAQELPSPDEQDLSQPVARDRHRRALHRRRSGRSRGARPGRRPRRPTRRPRVVVRPSPRRATGRSSDLEMPAIARTSARDRCRAPDDLDAGGRGTTRTARPTTPATTTTRRSRRRRTATRPAASSCRGDPISATHGPAPPRLHLGLQTHAERSLDELLDEADELDDVRRAGALGGDDEVRVLRRRPTPRRPTAPSPPASSIRRAA